MYDLCKFKNRQLKVLGNHKVLVYASKYFTIVSVRNYRRLASSLRKKSERKTSISNVVEFFTRSLHGRFLPFVYFLEYIWSCDGKVYREIKLNLQTLQKISKEKKENPNPFKAAHYF